MNNHILNHVSIHLQRAIEKLIEKEYLERAENQRDTYNYLA